MKFFEKQNAVLLPRFVLGLAIGVSNVYIKPAIAELGTKALDRLNIGIPSMEEIEAHIADVVAHDDAEQERWAA